MTDSTVTKAAGLSHLNGARANVQPLVDEAHTQLDALSLASDHPMVVAVYALHNGLLGEFRDGQAFFGYSPLETEEDGDKHP